MTRLVNVSKEEREYIDEAYLKVYNLLVGGDLGKRYESFKEYFSTYVKEIRLIDDDKVNSKCIFNPDKSVEIQVKKNTDIKYFKRELVHELSHAYIHLLSNLNREDKRNIIVDGCILENQGGNIVSVDGKTKVVDMVYLKVLNESMVDMISTILSGSRWV